MICLWAEGKNSIPNEYSAWHQVCSSPLRPPVWLTAISRHFLMGIKVPWLKQSRSDHLKETLPFVQMLFFPPEYITRSTIHWKVLWKFAEEVEEVYPVPGAGCYAKSVSHFGKLLFTSCWICSEFLPVQAPSSSQAEILCTPASKSTIRSRQCKSCRGREASGSSGSNSVQALANIPVMFGTLLTRQGLEDFTLGLECLNSTVALASGTQALLGQGPSVTQFRAHQGNKIITSHHRDTLQISSVKHSDISIISS